MIFDSNYTGGSVAPSRYEVGLEGALMHVYETQLNYNAMMKSAGISELKYYQETGGDLFVNEAGAFSGFLEKAKALFKKIIEKIKAIFARFAMMMNKFGMKDKDFVKKYRTQIMAKASRVRDFEYDGWEFKELDKYIADFTSEGTKSAFKDIVGKLEDITSNSDYYSLDARLADDYEDKLEKYHPAEKRKINDISKVAANPRLNIGFFKDSDEVDNYIEFLRGSLLGDNKKYDASEFRDAVKEKCYGYSKESFKPEMAKELRYIEETKEDTRKVDKAKKEIVDHLEKVIKALDKIITEVNKSSNTKTDDTKSYITKAASQAIDIAKAASDGATVAFGIIAGAVKDRNRQAKSICVKLMGAKNESAVYDGYNESYSYSDDIFSGVAIR